MPSFFDCPSLSTPLKDLWIGCLFITWLTLSPTGNLQLQYKLTCMFVGRNRNTQSLNKNKNPKNTYLGEQDLQHYWIAQTILHWLTVWEDTGHSFAECCWVELVVYLTSVLAEKEHLTGQEPSLDCLAGACTCFTHSYHTQHHWSVHWSHAFCCGLG